MPSVSKYISQKKINPMEKILITPLFGMGDTLTYTPALHLLKKHKQQCMTTAFVFNKLNYEILKHNPDIDKLWYYPLKATHFFQGILHLFKYFSSYMHLYSWTIIWDYTLYIYFRFLRNII